MAEMDNWLRGSGSHSALIHGQRIGSATFGRNVAIAAEMLGRWDAAEKAAAQANHVGLII